MNGQAISEAEHDILMLDKNWQETCWKLLCCRPADAGLQSTADHTCSLVVHQLKKLGN